MGKRGRVISRSKCACTIGGELLKLLSGDSHAGMGFTLQSCVPSSRRRETALVQALLRSLTLTLGGGGGGGGGGGSGGDSGSGSGGGGGGGGAVAEVLPAVDMHALLSLHSHSHALPPFTPDMHTLLSLYDIVIATRPQNGGGFMQRRWFQIRSKSDPGTVCVIRIGCLSEMWDISRDRRVTSVILLFWW